jgi:hypothetical protein
MLSPLSPVSPPMHRDRMSVLVRGTYFTRGRGLLVVVLHLRHAAFLFLAPAAMVVGPGLVLVAFGPGGSTPDKLISEIAKRQGRLTPVRARR